MRRKVYISGAVSSLPYDEAKAMFDEAKEIVNGYIEMEAVSPLDFDEEDKTKPWEWYMRKDIKLLMDCDMIYMLPNWRQSEGAKLERELAERLGIEVCGAF